MLAFPKFLGPNLGFTLKTGYEVQDPKVCEGLHTYMGIPLHDMHYAINYGDCICSMLPTIRTLLCIEYAINCTDSNVYAVCYQQ
jgi:hypothetical protein